MPCMFIISLVFTSQIQPILKLKIIYKAFKCKNKKVLAKFQDPAPIQNKPRLVNIKTKAS